MKSRKAVKILSTLVMILILTVSFSLIVGLLYPIRYLNTIQQYATEYHLTPELVCAVIHAESKFNKESVSSKGASGLMQITEGTATWLAKDLGLNDFTYKQIFDPKINIQLGCYYLNKLKKQYGNINVALCAYNAGSGNVDKWLKNSEYSSDGKTLIQVPFTETRNYLKRVEKSQKIYAWLLTLRK